MKPRDESHQALLEKRLFHTGINQCEISLIHTDISIENVLATVQARIAFLYASEGALMLITYCFLSPCELNRWTPLLFKLHDYELLNLCG